MSDKLELVKAVLDATKEVGGKKSLACSDAFRLAEAHRLDLFDIGEVCNEYKVKIVRCQLGCFK